MKRLLHSCPLLRGLHYLLHKLLKLGRKGDGLCLHRWLPHLWPLDTSKEAEVRSANSWTSVLILQACSAISRFVVMGFMEQVNSEAEEWKVYSFFKPKLFLKPPWSIRLVFGIVWLLCVSVGLKAVVFLSPYKVIEFHQYIIKETWIFKKACVFSLLLLLLLLKFSKRIEPTLQQPTLWKQSSRHLGDLPTKGLRNKSEWAVACLILKSWGEKFWGKNKIKILVYTSSKEEVNLVCHHCISLNLSTDSMMLIHTHGLYDTQCEISNLLYSIN